MTQQPIAENLQRTDAGVAIVGAGPAGSLLALALAQKGYQVHVYERRSDPRLQSEGAGRSINLGLSKRGMEALRSVGLLDRVLEHAVVMRGRTIHALDGALRFQPYGVRKAEVLHSIDRSELTSMLLNEAEAQPGVKFHFEHRLTHVDKDARALHFEARGVTVKATPQWVIGADGAFSTMRRELQRGERAEYHQEYLEWGYKELTLPAGRGSAANMELTSLHLWPRRHCLIVSHPNRNGSHTLTLFLPFEGEDSFATTRTAAQVQALFARYFPDLTQLLPELVEQWMRYSPGSLITTRTAPWRFEDWAVLVGDACHAVYPFYGQGMNSAFEDCSVLMEQLDACQGDAGQAFHAYETARRPQTDVLCALSKANFVELRQKVRSPVFRARKQLDLTIHRLFPRAWLPLYTMIAHTTIPYADALKRARRQENILLVASALLVLATLSASVALVWGR